MPKLEKRGRRREEKGRGKWEAKEEGKRGKERERREGKREGEREEKEGENTFQDIGTYCYKLVALFKMLPSKLFLMQGEEN